MALKTARLRELRLAKERLLIDPQSPTKSAAGSRPKARRAKQKQPFRQ
jgi:hypothetical protein